MTIPVMMTVRQQMTMLLMEKEMTARDLSRAVGIKEKEVYTHLSHIAHSVAARRKKLIIQPFRCLVCGYVFKNRKRFTQPGRCPNCKKGSIEMPVYCIC